MNSKILDQSNALNSGSTLWILPDTAHSQWASKMDWYLNGLITRSEQRTPSDLNPQLIKILKEEELSPLSFKNSPETALIVSSRTHLPNEMTVILPFVSSPKEWRQKISEIWKNLNVQTVRVFLPKGYRGEDFLEGFPNLHFENMNPNQIQLSLVVDSP